MRSTLATVAVFAVAFSLENAALAVAVVAFITAGLALLIVNHRLDKLTDVTDLQEERLSTLEQRLPQPPSDD